MVNYKNIIEEVFKQERRAWKNCKESEFKTHAVLKINIKVSDLNNLREKQLLEYADEAEIVDEFNTYEEAYDAVIEKFQPIITERKWTVKATLYFVYTHEWTVYRGYTVWDELVFYYTEKERQAFEILYADYPQYWDVLLGVCGYFASCAISEAGKNKYLQKKYNEIKLVRKYVDGAILYTEGFKEWAKAHSLEGSAINSMRNEDKILKPTIKEET